MSIYFNNAATTWPKPPCVAEAMKESFEYYNWEVNCIRLKKSNDWAALQPDLYFDDYDVVALGSPIVAGYPLTIINELFSLGAGGRLESNVQKMVDAGKGFAARDEMERPGDEGRKGLWKRRGRQLRSGYHRR